MAFTLTYQAANGITVTAGDTYSLEVDVYVMNSGYTYTALVSGVEVGTGNSYDIDYSADGVYKIVITENAVEYTYADINYSGYLSDYSSLLKNVLCTDCSSCDVHDYKDEISLGLIGYRFFAQSDFTITAVTDFSATANISELQKIYDAIQRITKYTDNINTDSSCCTTT